MHYVPTEIEGYVFMTSFHDDFDAADHLGLKEIKNTYNRTFRKWRSNIEYLTELVLVLNQRAWFWNDKNKTTAKLYDDLYDTLVNYINTNFSDEDLNYFYDILD